METCLLVMDLSHSCVVDAVILHAGATPCQASGNPVSYGS